MTEGRPVPSGRGLPKRILVVDDDPDVTALVVEILHRGGFEAWPLQDPRAVLRRAAEVRPDLVLVDFDMPGLTGPEVGVLLRSTLETRDVPFLFLSGMTDKDHHVIAEMSGAAGYIEKPIHAVKLLEMIHRLLDRPSSRE